MTLLDSYLVRVYRYNKHRPQDFIGTIQSTSRDNNQAFCSLEELWSILTSQLPDEQPTSAQVTLIDTQDSNQESEE